MPRRCRADRARRGGRRGAGCLRRGHLPDRSCLRRHDGEVRRRHGGRRRSCGLRGCRHPGCRCDHDHRTGGWVGLRVHLHRGAGRMRAGCGRRTGGHGRLPCSVAGLRCGSDGNRLPDAHADRRCGWACDRHRGWAGDHRGGSVASRRGAGRRRAGRAAAWPHGRTCHRCEAGGRRLHDGAGSRCCGRVANRLPGGDANLRFVRAGHDRGRSGRRSAADGGLHHGRRRNLHACRRSACGRRCRGCPASLLCLRPGPTRE